MQEYSFGRVGVISMPMKLLLQAMTVLVATVLFFILSAQSAYADEPGDLKFTISAQSGGGALSGVAVSLACTGGTIQGLGTTSATGTLFVAAPAGASCGAGDSYIAYALEKSGMVTLTALPGGSHETDELNAITSTMLYQVRVVVTDQEGTAFTHSDLDTITLNGIAASTTLAGASLFGNTGSAIALAVAENGYVAATTTNVGLLSISPVSSTQTLITFASSTGVAADIGTTATNTVRGLLFSHMVKTQRESDGAPLAGAAVSAGGITCNEESTNTGTYFCPVLVAGDGGTDDIHIQLDGYVKDVTGDTPNRDGNAAPVATTTVSSIDFSHKITIVSAVIGTAVTPDHVSAGANDVDCLIASNVAFCPVLLADDDTVAQGFDMQADGYVSTTVALASNRSASNTAQGAVVLTSSNGIVYGNVVTLLGNSNSIVTGATVKGGDGFGTTCTESGTSGVYYCAIPVANTSRTVQFVKSGYTTRTSDWASDRTASTSAQVTLTYNQFSQDQAGGSSATKATPSVTAIKLGDGSGTTLTRDILITFTGSNLYRYKIALSQADLAMAENPANPGTPIAYTLSEGIGAKTLWFQFTSIDGVVSAAQSKSISLVAPAEKTAPPKEPTAPVAPQEAPKVSVPIVPLLELKRVPEVIAPISATPIVPNFTPVAIAALQEGDLFMIEDATAGASVYWFTGGYKRPFPNEKTFLSWFPAFNRVGIKRVMKDQISFLAWGPSMPYKPGTRMIKVPDDAKTYNIRADGSACHVKDEMDAAKLFGKTWNKSIDDMSVSQFLGTYKIKDACVVA